MFIVFLLCSGIISISGCVSEMFVVFSIVVLACYVSIGCVCFCVVCAFCVFVYENVVLIFYLSVVYFCCASGISFLCGVSCVLVWK